MTARILDDNIDFVVISIAEVEEFEALVVPTGQLQKLSQYESFEYRSERHAITGQPSRGGISQSCQQTRIEKMDLRSL